MKRLFFLVALLMGVNTVLYAQTIRYVKQGGAGTKDGLSWANAADDLQATINASAVNDQVWVAAGTYIPTIDMGYNMKEGVKIYGGFPASGNPVWANRNYKNNITTLSAYIHLVGAMTVSNRVITNDDNGLTAAALLDGFTISGGLLNTTGVGAGMYNNNVSPTISNCIFYNNKTEDGEGGGVYNNGGAPTFINCTFSSNQADYTYASTHGGGGMANISSNPTLVNCTFSGNRAATRQGSGDGGGAIYNAYSNPVCTNCVFSGNDSTYGGAVLNLLSNPVFNQCSFTDNTSGYGAVTYNYTLTQNAHCIVQFNGCTFINNVASTYGGIAYNDYSNDETFTNCVFYGNKSYGIAAIVYNSLATSMFINCVLVGNTTIYADNYLYIIVNHGNTTLNKVDIGLYNTVLYGNSGGILFQDASLSPVNGEIKNSLVQSYKLGNAVRYFTATDNVDSAADPLFVDKSNPAGADGLWGTADDGLQLQPCSPLVNAGNNAFLSAQTTTDVTGNQRIYSGTVDIGAYESAYNPKITAITAQTNVICLTKGTATVMVSGGATPYTYHWSNGSDSAKAVNLAAGDYTCTITDANGCSLVKNFTITDASSTLTATTAQINPPCYGGNNGTASITAVSGGTAPYTYSWSNGSDSTKAVNLAAGNYSCTITDANGCSLIKNFTIAQPNGAIAIKPVSSQTVCVGTTTQAANFTAQYVQATDGAAACFVVGENQTQTITAPPGNIFTAVLFASYGTPTGNCAEGFTISDCHAPNSQSVVENLAIGNNSFTISVNNNTFSDPCYGAEKQLYIKLAYAPITYYWVNNNTDIGLPASGTGYIPAFTATGAGTATITVTAITGSGCVSAPVTFNYTVNEKPSATTAQTNISCHGGNEGSASITSVSGGDAPYTYLWSNGGTTETIANLIAGNYSCTITNAHGCSIVKNFTITQPDALTADVSQTDISCSGNNNGLAMVTVSGGTMPYTYNWSNGGTTETISDLTAGNYACTITDFNGCSIVKTFTITQPNVLTAYLASQTPASGADGTATIGVTGGTPPYAYNWSSGSTTATASGLSVGTYTCTVTDAKHCAAAQQSVTIVQTATGTTTLYVDGSITASGNGSDWASALKTLSDAFALAAQNSNISTILVAKGTYYPTGLQSETDRNATFLIPQRGNIKIYGGFPSGGGTFAQRELPSGGGIGSILSGDIGAANNQNDNSYHLMVIANIDNTPDSVVVDGFTFTKANGNGYSNYTYNDISTPQYNGGGIYINSSPDSKIAIKNCTFANNLSSDGAGIMNDNHVAPLIAHCTFTGNIADEGGGGIYNESASPVVVDSRFENNTAPQGGGMFNADAALPIITNCVFAGNTATDGYTLGGGGMANLSCSPTITNSLFTGNISQGSGYGGGISNYYASPNITNCTLSGNRATNNTGGGICNYNSLPVITNSIIYGNGVDIDNSSSPNGSNNSNPTLRYNIFQIVQGGFTGTGNSTANPLFINAPSYTTAPFTTGDYHLQMSSLAINAGTPDITGLNLPITDLAGNPRVQNGRIDMGAYEIYIEGTLPVSLISFMAKAEGNYAKLQWQTTNEQNNKGFEIYRAESLKTKAESEDTSTSSVGQFVKIGEVSAPVRANNYLPQQYTDKKPLNGTNYYKLVQIDNDGKATELGVRTVTFNFQPLTFNLYPNPTTDQITAGFAAGRFTQLQVTDVTGKVLQQMNINPAENSKIIALGQYPAGTYIVNLKGNGQAESRKAIKK